MPRSPSSPTFDFGDIGLNPVTNDWGFSRGEPVDRYYIESFLSRHAHLISGHVVEMADRAYTRRFGTSSIVESDVWDVDAANSAATIVADLADAPQVASETFDCFILTQVIIFIYDALQALREVHRVLKPGGAALITVPGISLISPVPHEAASWSWSFYPNTLRRLLCDAGFEPDSVEVESHGNLKTAIAFLAQLAQKDLDPTDFSYNDARYPLVVCAVATKGHS